MIANVLTLQDSQQRQEALIPHLQEHGVEYQFHFGEVDRMIPFKGINRSHKAIVRKAREKKEKMTCIIEDDVLFTAPGSWQYFLDNIPQEDFDIYLGGVSNGHINPDRSCVDFRGLFLYIVHERFYDTFLALNEMQNIDAELAKKGKYFVCNPFAAIHADGYSYHHGRHKTYGHLWKSRKLFGKENT